MTHMWVGWQGTAYAINAPPNITKTRAAGATSLRAIAAELDARRVSTAMVAIGRLPL